MKLKRVTITGMHKVGQKVYEFNDGITYFIGPNGAGKSTILEAVELALLGYIPGYSKKNDGIMKHASSSVMSITLDLEDNISITRTWTKSGTSVKSGLSTEGIECDESELTKLFSGIELPVFNFNEFRSMTSNKLKDWFIDFLPPATEEIDLKTELTDAIGDRQLPIENLLSQTDSWIANSGLSGIELIRGLNVKFKEDLSFVKGQIGVLTNTVQSLVKYDDVEDVDVDEAKDEIAKLEFLKNSVMQYNAAQDMYQKAKQAYDSLKQSLPADDAESDSRIKDFRDRCNELNKQIEILKADNSDLKSQIRDLQHQKSLLPKAGATCPYTNTPCETAASLASESSVKEAELDKQIKFKFEELEECSDAKINALEQNIANWKGQAFLIEREYDKLTSVKFQLESAESNLIEAPTNMNALQIDAEIRNLQDILVQAEANKRYEELSKKVTADKFRLDNELEVYKIWAKLTDPNGLQTTVMNKPFENLASDMSEYLTKMFGSDTTAKFNLVTKANSFSFGIERDGKYIEFDCLSSGEKCLFTLALILCILDKSESKIRTILIDDILDHLDESNASYLFETLKKIPDVQFILAGVKECSDTSICKTV